MGAPEAAATQPISASFNPGQYFTVLQGGTTALAEAESIVIDSDIMYQEGVELLQRVKGSKKQIEDAKETLLKPARAMAQAIRDFFDPGIARRTVIEESLKKKLIGYSDRKQKEAEAAQRQAEESARKEKERLEREAAAARARAEEEAAAKRRAAEDAERKRKEAEAAGNARAAAAAAAQAAKLNEEAQQKEAAGARQAEQLQERAALTSAPTAVTTAAPKAKGTSIRRPWKARVNDKEKLLQAIAANFKAYGHLIDIDEGKLNKMAGAQQKGLEAVLPGIECYEDASMASRST